MSKLRTLSCSLCVLTIAAGVQAAAPDAKIPPIKEIKGIKPVQRIYKASKANKPLVLKTQAAGKLYFTAKNLKRLTRSVDFKQQVVLVFAWRGSGKDKISYDVAESFPEQVQFTYTRGRTRDLRPHLRIFVLRSNVKWKVK